MRRAAAAAVVLAVAVVVALAVGGCGDADEPAARSTSTTPSGAIELTIAYDDGAGARTSGALTCRGADRRAEGTLDGRAPAAELCAQARGLAEQLTTTPAKGRTCTQIYGGPETAHVTGTIDGEQVDRRFRRTNGCEIADFTRAAGLLRP
jgi:outer membrane lipoprotein SlyB